MAVDNEELYGFWLVLRREESFQSARCLFGEHLWWLSGTLPTARRLSGPARYSMVALGAWPAHRTEHHFPIAGVTPLGRPVAISRCEALSIPALSGYRAL
jgi:hypothetical protein